MLNIVIVVLLALLVGALNGFLSAVLKLHPLIITLGTGFMVYGALLVYTKGVPPGQAPQILVNISSLAGKTLGIHLPFVIVVWAIIALLTIWLLRSTRFGRQIYAVGANSKAAELTLISRVRVWTFVFMGSAFLAAVTGILLAGYTGSGDVTVGSQYLFLSVGAVVIGGTSLLGGSGGYTGTIAGTILLTEISIVLVGMNVGPSMQEVLYGVIILIMISIYGRELHVKNRM